jgi:hypothetical protein
MLQFAIGVYLIAQGMRAVGWFWLVCSTALTFAMNERPGLHFGRMLKRSPLNGGDFTWTLGDSGVRTLFPDGKTQVEWRYYRGYQETPNLFLLYSPTHYQFIPKRAMSAPEIEEMRSILSVHLAQDVSGQRSKKLPMFKTFLSALLRHFPLVFWLVIMLAGVVLWHVWDKYGVWVGVWAIVAVAVIVALLVAKVRRAYSRAFPAGEDDSR